MEQVKRQLEQCLEKFRAGELSEGDLQQALESADAQLAASTPQLLYLQAGTTIVTSRVCGMSRFDADGQHDSVDETGAWVYETVLDAMRDGWRIVKFPEMALMVAGEEEAYGLGCEFILEK